MSGPIFYHEDKVTEQLELSRDTVRQVRQELLEKEKGHWEQRGRDIMLSAAGLQLLLEYLYDPAEISELDFSACIASPEKENGTVELTVTHLFPNRSLLLAKLPGSGEVVTVRVKDNSNFRPKMTLKARPPAPGSIGSAAFYQLEGRTPRYPGRY